MQLISDGASSVYDWQLEDPTWSHDTLGLLDVDGRARPVAKALESVFATLPMGATVFPSAPRRAGFAAAAFSSGGRFMVVLVNLSAVPSVIRLDLHALAPAGAAFDTVAAFPAGAVSAGRRYQPDAEIPLPATSLVVLRSGGG